MDIYNYLANNTYPGRGLLIGKYNDEMIVAYFIMGRSENSRNRVFKKKGDTIFTSAYDESKVKDPSLIIYNAVRCFEDKTIVTNGNQTDTIYDFLNEGKTFKEALETREYEPDDPNFTPRISAIVDGENYTISILKKKDDECERIFYEYKGENGKGHFISTYDNDGNPLPSFSKTPLEITITEDVNEFANKLWLSLNQENKISLYVRYINKNEYRDVLLNKNGD